MNWKTIFNPFLKFDEKTLFIAGILSISIVFVTSYFLGFQTDSLFHFTILKDEDSLLKVVASTLIIYAISILILFGLGKVINKRTRIIDIITPVFISQFPMIFLLFSMKIPFVMKAQQEIMNTVENQSQDFDPISLLIICIYSFVSLLISAYGITILYNGFKTATNLKKWQHIVIFAIILLTMMITMQFI